MPLTRTKNPSKQKFCVLLNCLGNDGIEIFNTFDQDWRKASLDETTKFFNDHCFASVSECFERYKFWCRDQHQGESINNYVTDLKDLSRTCNFEQQKEKIMCDRLVFGVYDKTVKERLLRESALNLQKAVEIGRAAESSRNKFKEMVSKTQVHMVNKTRNMVVEKKANDCGYCGTEHQRSFTRGFIINSHSSCKSKYQWSVIVWN